MRRGAEVDLSADEATAAKKPSEVTYFQIFGEIIHNNWWSERETGLLHFLQVVKKPSWGSRLLPITGRLTPKVQLMSKAKESNNLISLEKINVCSARVKAAFILDPCHMTREHVPTL